MSKTIASNLLATRSQFARMFSSSLEEIAIFLKLHLTKEILASELLNEVLLDDLWDVGLHRVKECVLKYNDIETAFKLLNIFDYYQHTFSDLIYECYKNCSESVMRHFNYSHVNYNHYTNFTEDLQDENPQIELICSGNFSFPSESTE